MGLRWVLASARLWAMALGERLEPLWVTALGRRSAVAGLVPGWADLDRVSNPS